jgi:hypothetical protein
MEAAERLAAMRDGCGGRPEAPAGARLVTTGFLAGLAAGFFTAARLFGAEDFFAATFFFPLLLLDLALFRAERAGVFRAMK